MSVQVFSRSYNFLLQTKKIDVNSVFASALCVLEVSFIYIYATYTVWGKKKS